MDIQCESNGLCKKDIGFELYCWIMGEEWSYTDAGRIFCEDIILRSFFLFSEFWSESLWMAILFRHTLWISLHFYYNFKRFNFSNKKRMHIKPSKSTTATTTMELADRISSPISLDITYIICISAARFDTFHTLYPTSIVKYRHNIEFSAWRMLFDARNSVPNGFQTQWPRNYNSKCKPRNTYLKSDWMFAIYIKKGLYKNQVFRHILNFHLIANIDIFLNSWIAGRCNIKYYSMMFIIRIQHTITKTNIYTHN